MSKKGLFFIYGRESSLIERGIFGHQNRIIYWGVDKGKELQVQKVSMGAKSFINCGGVSLFDFPFEEGITNV